MAAGAILTTRLLPVPGTPTPAGLTGGLSTEILDESARRLRTLALIYAFTFFMAGFVAPVVSEEGRAEMRAYPIYWLPDFVSIGMALLVATATFAKGLPVSLVMNLGLAFLVTSNFGIAAAEFINPARLDQHGGIGLSWVAVWTPLYTVAVPTAPRKALWAMVASVSAVPIVTGYMIASGRTIFKPTGIEFFFGLVFPYLLAVLLGYVGARVVYSLGKEVTRARDLGSYRLVQRLGQGGMGEVWRAEHRLLPDPRPSS